LDVLLARSSFAAGPWDRASYRTWCEFFKLSSRWQVPEWLRGAQRVLKAGEHGAGMRRFVAAMADERPDVIHFQWLPLPLLDALWIGPLQRIAPLVLTLHDTTLFHGAPSSALQGLGLHKTIRRFDRLIVHTEFSRQRAEKTGLAPADRLSLVPHGPLSYYRSQNTSNTQNDGVLRILFFGSIKPYKGLDDLLTAFDALYAEDPRRRLLVAGPPDRDAVTTAFMRRCERHPGSLVRAARVSATEMPVYLRAADAVVLPYRRTLNSGVLLLAYTFGLPVVAPDVPGIAELLGPDTARSFSPGDAADLARAMREVADLAGPTSAARARAATLAIARERAPERISALFFAALRERLDADAGPPQRVAPTAPAAGGIKAAIGGGVDPGIGGAPG
jgi:glycosyltransferase involved in cell wall biosynthesis